VQAWKKIATAAALTVLAAGALGAATSAPVVLKTTEFGRGPTVVLVHGVGGGRLTWMPTARKLLPGYRVVMVDLPGHGDSPMPDPFSYEAAAEALDGVLAKQKAESTVVVGQGAGGMIAVLAGKAHPDHVRGVVVIDGALKFPQAIPDQQRDAFLEFLDANFDDFMKMTFARQGRDSAQGVLLHAQASLVPRLVMRTYIAKALQADASSALKDFPRPLLYIGSEKGWPADKDWATIAKERGFELATGIQTMRIGASGAMIWSDQPDSLAMAISAFSKQAMAQK
jgi:pimeloyl-ACP methyl ester carboxylesterase